MASMIASEGCNSALKHALLQIKQRHPQKTMAILLSGGVDTAAIMEAHSQLSTEAKFLPSLTTAVAVFATETATDRPYCALLRERHPHINHASIDTSLDALLLILPFCVQSLATFDGMTLRNSLVIAMAIQRAKELGAEVVITGDGADELFGGYSFTWGTTDETIWTTKRNALATTMNFCTQKMAKAMGLISESPYMEQSFIDFAVTTSRADCVGERMIELAPGDERMLHITGKLCLREAFPDSPSAWRRKDPIEVGSGATDYNVSKSCYFQTLYSAEQSKSKKNESTSNIAISTAATTATALDAGVVGSLNDSHKIDETAAAAAAAGAAANEILRIKQEDRVTIRDLEHLYYYREFRRIFATDEDVGVPRFSTDPCVGCGFQVQCTSYLPFHTPPHTFLSQYPNLTQLKSPTEMFCHICGAWPARSPPEG